MTELEEQILDLQNNLAYSNERITNLELKVTRLDGALSELHGEIANIQDQMGDR